MGNTFEGFQTELAKLDSYYPESDLKHIFSKHREELVSILRAVEQIQEQRSISPESARVLEKGMAANWDVIYYYCAGRFLAELEPQYLGVSAMILGLLESKNWVTRRNIVAIADLFRNAALRNAILKRGLNDKSKKVVDIAADRILRYHLSDSKLKQCLLEAISLVKDPIQKDYLQGELELQTKGYQVRPQENGRFSIVVLKDEHSTIQKQISATEFEQIANMEEYVRTMKK